MSRPMARIVPRLTRGLMSSASAPRSSGAIGGVDPRIFSGIDGFVGKEQMSRVNEWQAGLWQRLADEVRNNPGLVSIKQKWDNDRLDMTDLLSFTAREPTLSLAFNYASLLTNNSYFLEGMNAEAPKPIPEHFQGLEDRVAAYADGVAGSGWLWLVKAGDGLQDFDVVPTFGSGTLLVTMRQQRGRLTNVPIYGTPSGTGSNAAAPAESAEASEPAQAAAPAAPAAPASAPRSSPFVTKVRTTTEVTPLAVCNLYEHAYLGDRYGVFGRADYARDWFKNLDWDKVMKRTASASSW